jgi:2-methylcitrate dehydratase PrpD
MSTVIERLARFTTEDSKFEHLPEEVIHESKRILLDSFGCALAAVDEAGAKVGIEHGRRLGKGIPQATILGTNDQVSVYGAAFANAELINALDFDAVLPPGHVAPYVIPGALAQAERLGASGKSLIASTAASHEMSHRLGKAMTYLRDIKDGKPSTPDVLGFSVTIFGATAAIAHVQDFDEATVAAALGISASISPVNAQRAWVEHAPSTTLKYNLPGQISQSAMTAASMAELGHRGDLRILDDAEFGYPKFIGSPRWERHLITEGIGDQWLFPAMSSFKPYPHCRVMHSLMDGLIDLVETHDVKVEEIESIRAWGEAWVTKPVWLNRTVENARDAQFSMAHGLAVAAHRIKPGKDWADLDLVLGSSVAELMNKTVVEPHPDWAAAISANPAARPARVELTVRGSTYTAERSYPKGSPSPDQDTYFTDDEIIAKFLHNAHGVIDVEAAERVVDAVMNLEKVGSVTPIIQLMAASNVGASVG